MAIIKGIKCRAYMQLLGSATAYPTFTTHFKNIESLTINVQKDSEEINIREETGFQMTLAGLKKGTASFTSYFDPEDPLVELLTDAYFNDKDLVCFFASGDASASGSQGLRGVFTVTNFSMEQPAGACKISVEMALTYNANLTSGYHIVA